MLQSSRDRHRSHPEGRLVQTLPSRQGYANRGTSVLAQALPIYVYVSKEDSVDEGREAVRNKVHSHTIGVKDIELERHASESGVYETSKNADETTERFEV